MRIRAQGPKQIALRQRPPYENTTMESSLSIPTQKSRLVSLLIHVLGWASFGFVLFLVTPLSWKVDLPDAFWGKQAFILVLLVLAFYFNMLYLVPKLLFSKHNYLFLLIILLAGAGYLGLLLIYDDWVDMQRQMHQAFRPDVPYTPKPRNLFYFLNNLWIFFLAVGTSTAVAAVQKWQSDERQRRAMERERVNSELSYLKAQINPHFFFNTLNNIYALTNIEVDRAKQALLKLSRMMRYVLYETQKDLTPLQKEIDFLHDYIELMQLRLTDSVSVEMDIAPLDRHATIAPMLLLPLVENCFKHGISTKEPCTIHISLALTDQSLTLRTQNQIFTANKDTPEGKASGIGIANTRRRLELLYPDRYKLTQEAREETNTFIATLSLKLS